VRDGSPDLSALTTLRLGGPAKRLVTAERVEEVPGLARDAAELLVLAGGSNVVVADEGFPGTVLLLRTRGVAVDPVGADAPDGAPVRIRVAAGHPWDELVAESVERGWSGLECLAGIPGSAGATPIQNVGAYGQEVAELITAVEVYDRDRDAVYSMAPADCGFVYRGSVFKHSTRWIVLSVTFQLTRSPLSAPVRYAELGRALGVELGERVPLAVAQAAVRSLRAGKGMVLDPADPDTWSAGSFFTNPVLPGPDFARLVERAGPGVPAWPGSDGTMKISAAWLIEHAGFTKGYGHGRVGISGKHTLALTNRGTGTTAALLDLAREIRAGVHARFGVTLRPEVMLVNCAL
jgi:UDP-N-acetylmuramate dehydrogenase